MVNCEPLYFGHLYLPIQPNLPEIYDAFMRNEPNSQNEKMNINKVSTKDYANILPHQTRKNKPKTNPIKPETKPKQSQNKPNMNPKQTQSNPISKEKNVLLQPSNRVKWAIENLRGKLSD